MAEIGESGSSLPAAAQAECAYVAAYSTNEVFRLWCYLSRC